jgi:hypothetical protein
MRLSIYAYTQDSLGVRLKTWFDKTSITWRKKWERCWDEVKYCSERCRRRKMSLDGGE